MTRILVFPTSRVKTLAWAVTALVQVGACTTGNVGTGTSSGGASSGQQATGSSGAVSIPSASGGSTGASSGSVGTSNAGTSNGGVSSVGGSGSSVPGTSAPASVGASGTSTLPPSSTAAGTSALPSSSVAGTSSSGGGTVAVSLLFSEYVEGSSNNKAIEVVNATGQPVSLQGYSIAIHNNGAATASNRLELAGVLPPNGTLAVCNGSATSELAMRCAQSAAAAGMPTSTSSVAAFNGDDTLVLEYNGAPVDRFGDGLDPGTQWGSSVASVNQTLRRNCGVTSGWLGSTFDPATQWTSSGLDDFSNVGAWHCQGGGGSSSSASVGGGSSASVGPGSSSVGGGGSSSAAPPSSSAAGTSSSSSVMACGDGVVSPPEVCDRGIPQGSPGACPLDCPRLEVCTARSVQGGWSTCDAVCVDSPITTAGPEDMCCVNASDPDCLSAYPVADQVTSYDTAGGFWSCVNQRQTNTHLYIPLAPTSCGQPVILNVSTTSPGLPNTSPAFLDFLFRTPSGAHAPAYFSNNLYANRSDQASFLVGMSSTRPSFVTVDENVSYCGTLDRTEVGHTARPLSAVSVSHPAADALWLATDVVGQQVFTRASGVLTVTSGRHRTGAYLAGPLSTFSPASWTQTGQATVASNVAEVDVASEPNGGLMDAPPPLPNAHVVWTNPQGTELRYARVSGNATVQGAVVLRTGSGMARPRVIMETAQRLAVAWVEGNQLLLARITPLPAAGALNTNMVVATAGSIGTPSLTFRSPSGVPAPGELAVAWVDNASGSNVLRFMRVSDTALTALAPAEVVSTGAVAPTSPNVETIIYGGHRVTWEDARAGHRAVFIKDNLRFVPAQNTNVASTFAGNPDHMVSPAGVDSHSPRVGPMPLSLLDDGSASGSLWVPWSDPIQFEVAWTEGTSGAPMFSQVKSVWTTNAYEALPGFPMRLSCNAGEGVRVQAAQNPRTRFVGAESLLLDSNALATWLEGGTARIQAVHFRAVGRVPGN